MKAFIYKGELYIRCVPGKQLFRSTMVHEVVNRGDIFALRVSDQLLTIIDGKSEVVHLEASLDPIQKPLDKPADSGYTAPSKSQKQKLDQLALELSAPKYGIGELVRLSWWNTKDRPMPIVEAKESADGWRYRLRGMTSLYCEHNLRKA